MRKGTFSHIWIMTPAFYFPWHVPRVAFATVNSERKNKEFPHIHGQFPVLRPFFSAIFRRCRLIGVAQQELLFACSLYIFVQHLNWLSFITTPVAVIKNRINIEVYGQFCPFICSCSQALEASVIQLCTNLSHYSDANAWHLAWSQTRLKHCDKFTVTVISPAKYYTTAITSSSLYSWRGV